MGGQIVDAEARTPQELTGRPAHRRDRHGVRLQIAYWDRSTTWVHPHLIGQRCRPIRWPGTAEPDRPGEHWQRNLDGYGVPQSKERGYPARWGCVENPFPQGTRQAASHTASASLSKDRSTVELVFATQKHLMCLFIRTIGIKCQGKDRPRQHRIQLQALPVLGNPREHCMRHAGDALMAAQRPFRRKGKQ